MGTGTRDMIDRCRDAGLDEPEFTQSDGFVTTIRRRQQAGLIERTIPDRPNSRLQKYRLTVAGRARVAVLAKG